MQITEATILECHYFKTATAKRHTLTNLIDRYLATVLPHKGASSIRKQTQQPLWWKTRLGHYLVADITPALLAEYWDTLARGEDTCRSNKIVILYLGALSHAFTIAVREWQWCYDNPVRKTTKPKAARGRVRFRSVTSYLKHARPAESLTCPSS